MRKSMLILLLSAIVQFAYAQSETARRKGDQLYAAGDYYGATQSYEMWLGKKNSFSPYTVAPVPRKGNARVKSIYQLAESYRALNDYEHAGAFYQQVLAEYPMANYWYGICLRSSKQYTKAQQQFEIFLKRYRNKDELYKKVMNELNNCRFIITQLQSADSALYHVERMPAPVNVQVADYAAVYYRDSILTFTSSRRDSTAGRMPYYNRIYQLSSGIAKAMPFYAGKEMHNGVAVFNAYGSEVYFTGWTVKGGVKTTAIYKAVKADTGWRSPVKLPAPVNIKGANAMEPFISGDKLVFSADRKGGKGGYDLWYVTLDGKKMSKAYNMGDSINTAGDERAPYYHQPSGTLVYSSNGKTGMGGFDLYMVKGDFVTWQTPENMGYPVNSVKDDIYFFSKQKEGILEKALISSDRASKCCLEVFEVSKEKKDTPATIPEPATTPTLPPPPPPLAHYIEVFFDYNLADLTPSTRQSLDSIAAVLKNLPERQISISGYTDAHGTSDYNYRLGMRRAEACAAYLRNAGVNTEQVKVVSYGKDHATTGEAKERKVVITFIR